jgi:hypothetical protein
MMLVNLLVGVCCAVSILAGLIINFVCKKLKREKMAKHLAIETAKAVVITHWTKRVTVEKQNLDSGSNSGTVNEPLVGFDLMYSYQPILRPY